MQNIRQVTPDLWWVGANDRRLGRFENIHPIYHGVSYNSYLLLDEQTVLFDAADWAVGRQFIENVEGALKGRKLDYIVVHHAEPDHAATVEELLLRWPEARVIASAPAVTFLRQFGMSLSEDRVEKVKEGDERCFGRHTVSFVAAPMVHWPEVLVSYDRTDGVLFSADAFGSFRSLDGKLFADEVDFPHEWLDEARRYYSNIVGKHGTHVQALLEKAAGLDVKYICPLHGPVWRKDIPWLLDKYAHWAAYEPEEKGVMIVYGSMYGGTENAAEALSVKLAERGVTNTRMYDVSGTHVSYLISDIFKYSHLVLAGVTYNLGLFPPMHALLEDMKALNVQNRVCAVMENGTWAIRSGDLTRKLLGEMKDMTVLSQGVKLTSAPGEKDGAALDALADALAASVKQ